MSLSSTVPTNVIDRIMMQYRKPFKTDACLKSLLSLLFSTAFSPHMGSSDHALR